MSRLLALNKDELKRIIRFCLVGFLNTAVDYAAFSLLFYVFQVDTYISQAAAFLIATFNSYICNRRFTFKSHAKMFGKNLAMFYILNIISMSVSLVFLYFFHDFLSINELIAKLLTSPFVFAVNYLGNRLIIFRTTNKDEPPS